jgi:phosphoribosylformylglycinamidine cyclo-ligase
MSNDPRRDQRSAVTDYKSAGVDIDAANEAVARLGAWAQSTFSPAVLTDIGGFGGLYDLQALVREYRHPVLVQSIDGVGTKIIVARMMGKYDTIGADLLSACCNDIVVLGARPLTLLDYIANDRLDPDVVEALVAGLARACRAVGVSLIGGETAEMPDTYRPGEQDLVGAITGVVEKDRIVTGDRIQPGDVVLGLPASGLHTNGYSLARKLFFEVGGYTVDSAVPELGRTVGEELLEPHRNYTLPVRAVLDAGLDVKGMAHITGGGLVENLPRILPAGCAVEIRCDRWPVLPVFRVLQELGHLNEREMYRTFNMGIGLTLITAPDNAVPIRQALEKYFPVYTIGEVTPGEREVSIE